jgi:hypothetical protein
VETNTADTTHDSAAAEKHHQRGYPQFDCVGAYLWIWERLSQADGATTVVARHVYRDGPIEEATHQLSQSLAELR